MPSGCADVILEVAQAGDAGAEGDQTNKMLSDCADVTIEFVRADDAGVEAAPLRKKQKTMKNVGAEGDQTKEMLVSSHVLRLASPVFNAMLTSGMIEGQAQRIKVDIASKEEFDKFYRLLLPAYGRKEQLSEGCVDAILALSDYYQVEALKAECEAYLMSLPISIHRLLQSEKHGIKMQYARCLASLKDDPEIDLKALKGYPEIIFDLAIAMQQKAVLLKTMKTMAPRIKTLVAVAHEHIPSTAMFQGQRLNHTIRGEFLGLLSFLK